MAKRRIRRSSALAGTGLSLDPRSGNYIWRKTDPRTGQRLTRSTRTSHLRLALKVADGFEEEFERELAGLPSFADWRVKLRPLAEAWTEHQLREEAASERWLRAKHQRLLRALEDLGLKTAADLLHVARIHDRLMGLRRDGEPISALDRAPKLPGPAQAIRRLAGREPPLPGPQPAG